MALIALNAAAAVVGKPSFLGSGSILGNLAMSLSGRLTNNRLAGKITATGARLKDLSIQSSGYGAMIPIVYGTVRVAGNVIWAMPIKEHSHASVMYYSSIMGSKHRTHIDFTYSVSFAISICEGVIDEILRVWAGDKLISLSRYNVRIYRGTETQMPDFLIEDIQGKGKAPAYRGQAYVVFEDFPLGEFGNSLPNFTFEVRRNVKSEKTERLEDIIESIIMIPGSGEYVYDTIPQSKIEGDRSEGEGKWCQKGKAKSINVHNISNKANALVALDQLKETLPNVKWVSPVVTWFGTNLKAGSCHILPGVEYNAEAITLPDTWKVESFSRASAHQITKFKKRPVYGGTVNDASVVRYIDELKTRGYKIMFYPMFFMDTPKKPWRGRVTGSPVEVREFFTRETGYNRFILHYAKLMKGKVDAFVIGSELIGLTKISDDDYNFPAVDELVQLAAQVREIMGKDVILTYAADWSEYHHCEGGWYNLDKLWASPDIDVVGIDAYFPLTNTTRSVYDYEEIMKGWTKGEGYDYYYEDSFTKTGNEVMLDEHYAWKNIEWWWSNEHINPDGNKTAWKPKSKKIWFTEYGFPSVDCCSNMPNVFYDPLSRESFFPNHSLGRPDFKAQRVAIYGTEKKWQNSDMVERKFLWTWDARPYPFWPDLLNIWSDGGSWIFGHWVQGKLGMSALGSVVEELSSRAGLNGYQFETSKLKESLEGMVIDNQSTIRNNIELLQHAYFFDSIEKDGRLEFSPRESRKVVVINSGDLLEKLNIARGQENELPRKVDINFINIVRNYRIGNQHAIRHHHNTEHCILIDLPICMTEPYALHIAQTSLYNIWMERTQYNFLLPTRYMALNAGDLVSIDGNIIRITSINYGCNLALQVEGVAENLEIYGDVSNYLSYGRSEPLMPLSQTRVEILDLPALTYDFSQYRGHIYLGVTSVSENWSGATIFISTDEHEGYEKVTYFHKPAVIGNILNKLPDRIIPTSKDGFIVNILSGELADGHMLALIGDEVVEFSEAKLIGEYQYRISGIVRGKYGSIRQHVDGERFVLLNQDLYKYEIDNNYIGKTLYIKAVTSGDILSNTPAIKSVYQANTLRPYSPVNLTYTIKDDGGISFSWKRRSRIQGQGNHQPLGEEREEYYYELLSGTEILQSGLVNVCRCESTLSEGWDNLVFQVAQVSSVVGNGDFAQLHVIVNKDLFDLS